MKKILCIGPLWRGSDADGLFNALSRIGNLITVVDENYYINLSNRIVKVKALDWLFRGWHTREFNDAILREARNFTPDIALVYKGAFVLPETLQTLKKNGAFIINFYPDVSFKAHGNLLPKTLPLYDHIFTTKSFGVRDMKEQLGITSSTFIPHGFDPDIHRRINIPEGSNTDFKCDITFIGGWSLKKEKYIHAIKKNCPEAVIKIWGGRWDNCKIPELQSSIMGTPILGDLYTMGLCSSKIVLGLLHEQVEGSSSGDLITARSFQIPGAGCFMLHERTLEIVDYFVEDEEIVCFSDELELVEKVKKYLYDSALRERVAEAGYQRSLRDHSLDVRARFVLDVVSKIKNA